METKRRDQGLWTQDLQDPGPIGPTGLDYLILLQPLIQARTNTQALNYMIQQLGTTLTQT